MDVSGIPKTFWHAISLSVLIATIGLITIAYRAASVSIEVANTKIELSAAINQTREFKSQLDEEYEQLATAKKDLQAKIDEIQQLVARSSQPLAMRELETLKALETSPSLQPKATIPKQRLEEFDKTINRLQQSIMQQTR